MTTGKVWLVGAGPGDPGLITVAGLERLRQADVIVYDRLVSPRLLEHAREGAELIFVGKVAGESLPAGRQSGHNQAKINELLVEKAREGGRVVRLKGGDPFVFGRGGEEAEALRAAGVPFEVVPGVTSAAAVPAYAGIPVTHRGLASSFAVVTGHEDPGKGEPAVDWGRLATAVDTLVLLMGVQTLPEIVGKLIEGGRPAATPVAVIQWGTTPDQRTVTGTLADIVQRVQEAGVTAPAVTVVGEVVRLRETLAWFEDRPLFGKRVLITRTRRQASALARLLSDEGAVPIELPAIEIEPAVDEAAAEAALDGLRAGAYAWVVFTSANAVELFFGLMRERGLDLPAGRQAPRAFAGARAAAIGPATAEALSAVGGITADAVPEEYIAEGVVDAMRPHLRQGDRVLVPRAEGARPELVEGLRGLGAEVDEVTLYRAVVPREAPAEALSLLREGGIDIVTFTSSSTVRNLAALLGGDFRVILSRAYRQAGGEDAGAGNMVSSRRNLESGVGGAIRTERGRTSGRRPLVACIGPITAKTARELGLRVDVEAEEHTIPGMVRAIRERMEHGRGP